LFKCRPAFLIAAGLACAATVLAAILAWRTRSVYRRQRPTGDAERPTSAVSVTHTTPPPPAVLI